MLVVVIVLIIVGVSVRFLLYRRYVSVGLNEDKSFSVIR